MEDFYLNKGLKRLVKFDENAVIQVKWSEKVIAESDIPNLQFYNSCFYYEKHRVPIKDVIGTSHGDYANLSWLQILGGLKRFRDWTKESFLDYIENNKTEYVGFSFAKYGNKYVVTQGNHRTCFAVLSNIKYVETNVCEYYFDEHLYIVYNWLKNNKLLSEFFDFNNVKTSRPTERLWVLNLNNRDVYIRNQNSLDYFLKLYQSTSLNWKNYRFTPLRRKFVQLEEHLYISIYSEADVDKLVDDIILHKINLSKKL